MMMRISTLQKVRTVGFRKAHCTLSQMSLLPPISITDRDDKKEKNPSYFSNTKIQPSATGQRRYYHETPRRELVLYGAIAVAAAVGYVGYCIYNGKPIKPESAAQAQEQYRKMEEERKKRNEESEKRVQKIIQTTNKASEK